MDLRPRVNLNTNSMAAALVDLVQALERQDLVGVRVNVTFVYPPIPRRPERKHLGTWYGCIDVYEEDR